MPYEEQDIKPLLEEKINLTESSLPSVTISYDGQEVSSQSNPYAFIEFIMRKSGHILGYLGLTIVLFLTITQTTIKQRWIFLFSGLIAIVYALLDEWHQTFVPGRTGHWEDALIVDGMGVVLGLLIMLLRRGILHRYRQIKV